MPRKRLPPHHGRVTIDAVAARAGVSSMTVSRVANGSAEVRDETRQRVQAAIEELGYVPNRVARGLSAQRLGAIAVLVPDVANPFFTHIVRAVDDVVSANGFAVMLSNSHEDPTHEAADLEVIAGLQLDGAIIGATGDESATAIHHLQRAGRPVVLIDREVAGVTADLVLGTTTEPARALTAHLIEHGHERIGMAAGPASASTSRERIEGFRAALHDAAVEVDERAIVHCAFLRAAGRIAALQMLDLSPPPTAIVAANSFIAFGVIDAARERGLHVPRDLAIVSFDDFEVTAREPFLTCADQPARELGTTAAQLLLDRLDGDEGPVRIVRLDVQLRIRSSCGCPPSEPSP